MIDTAPNLTLVLTIVVLVTVGVYLLLERSMTRVLLGFLLVGNATNLLLLTMVGKVGSAPIVEDGVSAADMTDPMPEALILTAIVITFGVTTLLLALAYRSWLLTRDDEVQDDVGDRTVARADVVHDEVADLAKVIAREEMP